MTRRNHRGAPSPCRHHNSLIYLKKFRVHDHNLYRPFGLRKKIKIKIPLRGSTAINTFDLLTRYTTTTTVPRNQVPYEYTTYMIHIYVVLYTVVHMTAEKISLTPPLCFQNKQHIKPIRR